MWRSTFGLGLNLSVLFAIACFSQTGTTLSELQSEEELRSFLQRYVRENGVTDSSTRYRVAFVDLNDDGKKEAIVYLMGRWWCGSGGCPTLVLTPEASSYRLVTRVQITRPPIRVLTTRSHGWRTLTAWVEGGGIQPGYEAELPFDGGTYPISAANPPARRLATVGKGDVVLPESANDIRTGKSLYP